MRRAWPVWILTLLLLTGCQQVELYSDLSELEGNEMLAVLLSHGIPASKTRTKAFVSIAVPKQDVSAAIETLRQYGFPRDRFTDLGEIFQKQGLISSPMEERVRYTFGLSQMLGETIDQIDGVLAARVLIVLPEEPQFGKPGQPASAAVFIRYLPGLGIEEAVPRIKMLVQNSVDGLDYDRISVVLFPRQERPTPPPAPTLRHDTASVPPLLALALGGGLLAALAGNGYLFWRLRGARAGSAKASEQDSAHV